MENGHSFAPLLLSRFKKLRLPVVVGEILAGILVGRSGFGWVAVRPVQFMGLTR